MHSVRWFFVIWSCVTVAILAYAGVDLSLHPKLLRETHFSMQPDITRAAELVHWGGRLLKEGHTGLLIANAILLAGLATLTIGWIVNALRRPRGGMEHGDAHARPSMP